VSVIVPHIPAPRGPAALPDPATSPPQHIIGGGCLPFVPIPPPPLRFVRADNTGGLDALYDRPANTVAGV